MDFQGPDSDQGTPQGTVENDFVRPLQPMKSVSHRRLPAALPFAIAGLLVVTSVALGAGIIRQNVTPPPDASGVAVGDDNPTDTPTPVITATPTVAITDAPVVTAAPTAVPPLAAHASLSGTSVKIEWSQYQGDNFAYYKVVRSTDATVSWPLGDGDTLVAAISNIDQLSYVDPAPLGKTFNYEVFAVKSSGNGYAVLVGSNVVAIATPQPTPAPTPKPTPAPTKAPEPTTAPTATPAPTASCGISLSYQLIAPVAPAQTSTVAPAHLTIGYSVKFTWTRYNCDHFQWYGVQKANNGTPTLELGNVPNFYYSDNQDQLTTTDYDVQLGQTYSYRSYAFTEESLASTGGIQPACYATTILATSNIVTVTIPAS